VACQDDHCITCGDVAERMIVLSIDRTTGLACCNGGEEVDVALVDVAPGDVVLVHAGVALQRLEEAV
jgi:hydrogenase expression/formation protein HypC